jgi:predicted  nucleic acid-binding Zn-ribbon protein
MKKTIASLRDELAAAPKPEQLSTFQNELASLKKERDTLLQENQKLIVTIQDLQPQADALARIKSDVQTGFGSMLNTDERVRSLQAELDSLRTTERTMSVLERMKEILRQLVTLQHAYQV